MRIAIIAQPYLPIPPTQYGGIEQVICNLIDGLTESGHEAILLAPGDSKVSCELIPTTDHSIPFPRAKRDLKVHTAAIKQAHKTTSKVLKSLLPRIDIVHSHGFDLLPFRQFPNLTTLHNMIKFEDLPYYKRRKSLYYASISKNQQASYPDLKYVGVVYNGENPDSFPITTEPEPYVCFLGRFEREKSPHLAIQLALSLGIKIKLAGKVDYRAEGYFEEEIEKYLNHPLVDYLGELGFDDKVELLSKAKCNLHPTNFREPFGLTVLEAAYCGTPTLAVSKGSMSELIEQGRTGVLVEDFVEGHHHIEECFAMDREYIASRARQLFNYRTMTRQYIEAYEHIISEFPQKRASKNIFEKALRKIRRVEFLPKAKA